MQNAPSRNYKTLKAGGLYSKRQVSATVNVFKSLESLHLCLCCRERSQTPGHRATPCAAPELSPWLLGDKNPSICPMCPAGKEHPTQLTLVQTHLAQTVCLLGDLIFLASSKALNAIELNQSHTVRWQILNKVLCNSGYPTLHTNRLDSTVTNSSYLQIDHLRHML